MGIKMLTRENIPCWYELSWRPGIIPAIILRIHRDFIQQTQPIDPEKSPIIAHFIKEFNFRRFSPDFNGNFGFDDSFQWLGEREGFSEFLIPLPVVKKQTGKKCRSCGGSGKDEYIEDSDCLYCEGSGRESIIEWSSAFAVSATLTVRTTLMRFPEHETSA